VGNSQIKLGRLLPGGQRPQIELLGQILPAQLAEPRLPFALPAAPVQWRVISVSPPVVTALEMWVACHRPDDQWLQLSYLDLPLTLAVDLPERVGMDRLAAAVGANSLRAAGQGAIVIDAGTAITVDAVDAAGTFLGGLILPGPRIAAKSLAVHTAQLPDVLFDPQELPSVIGTNTVDAIRGGIYWGLLGALELLVAKLRDQLGPHTEVFVTGGAIEVWSAHLSTPARYVPDLVLIGIASATPRLAAVQVTRPDEHVER